MGVAQTRDDEAAVRLAVGAAGYALGQSVESIIGPTRGSADTAFARQVSMYLCHVAFEWSLARVAEAFRRDRSTVAHACHSIEDRRDDETFDDWIAALEQSVRAAASVRGAVR
jgi:chromosomal replication initiation ATPase DnaA